MDTDTVWNDIQSPGAVRMVNHHFLTPLFHSNHYIGLGRDVFKYSLSQYAKQWRNLLFCCCIYRKFVPSGEEISLSVNIEVHHYIPMAIKE